jgi:hypothetical protein
MVISDDAAAATVTAARSVANGGIDIDVPAAAAMSAKAAASIMLGKGEGDKKDRRILIFRRNTGYYNSVWAVD